MYSRCRAMFCSSLQYCCYNWINSFCLHDICEKRYYVNFHNTKLMKIAACQMKGEVNFQCYTTRLFFLFFRKHMKFYDITKDSLANFPLLDKMQKQIIYHHFNCRNMNRARVILFTKRFLKSLNGSPRNIAIVMLVVSALCLAVSVFQLLHLTLHYWMKLS